MTTLEGERVRLRPLTDADVGPEYVAWLNDPEVNRFLESRFVTHTDETVAGFVRAAMASSTIVILAIEVGGRHVGNIKLEVDPRHRRGDIGIMIGDRGSWGRGYATEAIDLLSTWALAQDGIDKVTAGAYAPNLASIRSFERAGFTVEGVLRSHAVSEDGRVDVILLGRLS